MKSWVFCEKFVLFFRFENVGNSMDAYFPDTFAMGNNLPQPQQNFMEVFLFIFLEEMMFIFI